MNYIISGSNSQLIILPNLSFEFYKKEKGVLQVIKMLHILVDIIEIFIYNINILIRRCMIYGYKSVANDTVCTFCTECVAFRQG